MKYLITGGTGTIGTALLDGLLHTYQEVYDDAIQGTVKRCLKNDTEEVRIFSRDETKQHAMKLTVRDPRVKFYIGDVRNKDSIRAAMSGVDIVFHAAAMKHVWSCEEFPMEAFETNVRGTANVVDCAIEAGVKRFVLISSDKAVNPSSVMGATKLMAEKIVLSRGFGGVRFGNLINSRGSVLEVWRKQLLEGIPCTLTDPDATRFFMTIEQAVRFCINCDPCGFIATPTLKACTVMGLWLAFSDNECPYKIIGLQPGEKKHEYMREDVCSQDAERFTIDELKQMI